MIREFSDNNKSKRMGSILYIIAVILIIGWLIGFFGFAEAVGSFIHILLVIAVILIVVRLLGVG